MKYFLLKTGLFGIFAFAFYIIAMPIWSIIFPPFLAKNVRSCVGCYGHFNSRTKDAKNVKNPDILFLGSSHSYRGFDTRVFEKNGFKTFNFGSSSQSPINTNVILKQYIDEIKPKFVIYEVFAGTIGVDGQESSLDILSNGKLDYHAVNMAFEQNKLNIYNTLIFSSFRNLFNLNSNFVEPEKQNGDFYIKNGGYVATTFKKNPLREEEIKPWNINPQQWEKLKENIAILKEKKIPYLLVQTPITQKLYDARKNNNELDEKLSKLGPYKNFYGDLILNDTIDFYDSNHMNQQAVEQFNEHLIQYLKDHHLIKK